MTTLTLTTQQELELRFRAASTRDLLVSALRLVRDHRLTDANHDSVMTSLATGLGRLYDLVEGLRDLDQHGHWTAPAPPGPRRRNLEALHTRILDFLMHHPGRKDPVIDRWVCRIIADPVIPGVVTALTTYSRSTESLQPERTREQVRDAVNRDPGVSNRLDRANELGGGELWAAYRDAWDDRLAAAVETLWFTLALCGRRGLLGPAGETVGTEVFTQGPVRTAA